ncbi:hypothetical protein H0H93_013864, partial [Arthromyces matolae]
TPKTPPSTLALQVPDDQKAPWPSAYQSSAKSTSPSSPNLEVADSPRKSTKAMLREDAKRQRRISTGDLTPVPPVPVQPGNESPIKSAVDDPHSLVNKSWSPDPSLEQDTTKAPPLPLPQLVSVSDFSKLPADAKKA